MVIIDCTIVTFTIPKYIEKRSHGFSFGHSIDISSAGICCIAVSGITLVVAASNPSVGGGFLSFHETPKSTTKFVVCSSDASRFVVAGTSIPWEPDYFVPRDGNNKSGLERKDIINNEVILPPNEKFTFRRVGSDVDIAYAEVCVKQVDGTWRRLHNQVGYEDITQTNPIVMSFSTSSADDDYPIPCTIDGTDCDEKRLKAEEASV